MQTSTLPFRTPAEYLAAAKRLQREGSKDAPQMMRAAALAYATAHAADRGDTAKVQMGLAGLRAMALGDAASDLDTTLRNLRANPQVRQYVGLIAALSELANGVIAIVVQMTGNATDPGVAQALGWMRFITGASATPPGLSEGDIRSLADFVRATAFLDNADIVDGIMGAVRGVGAALDYATRSTTSSQVIQVVSAVVGFFRLFRSRLAENTRIRALLDAAPPGSATTTPVDPTNCMTLTCPPGQVKAVRSGPGSPCECGPPTAISEAARALQNYRTAVASRKLVEGILVLPEGRLTAGARRSNCTSSCTLLWASTELKRITGSIPAIPGTPAQSNPIRYFDSRTAPSDCRCTGMTLTLPGGPVFTGEDSGGAASGGISPIAIAGGAAAVGLLFYLFR